MTYLKNEQTQEMSIFKKSDKPAVNYDPNKTFIHPDELKRREEAAKAKAHREKLVKQVVNKKVKFNKFKVRMYTDNCLLVNPKKDMSEKELYARNGFKNPINNLVNMMRNGGRIKHSKNQIIQLPEKLGEYTKDHHGVVMEMGN